MIQNEIPGCYFLDLFAGSGQMGLEAVSRGAEYAVFADNSRKAAQCIEDNIHFTKFDKQCRFLNMDAVSAIRSLDGKYRFDIIFMDIQMPVMNGYEATAAIRSLPGEKGKLPIVAMTANAFAEDVQLAKNTGMNGHIAKPLDMNKLNDVLESWL